MIITVDPETGTKDVKGEPLKTLYKYRQYNYGEGSAELIKERKKKITGPPLSINCSVDQFGHVHVGDPIWAYI